LSQQQEPEQKKKKEKEKEKQQQQYKAFAGKGWNARTQTFSEVKVYTLETEHVQMNHELLDYYEAHPTQQIVVTRGDDKRVGTINRELRFPANSEYVIVPLSLQMKRYRYVPATELELLEQECKDEGIRFAGQIRGITPIREVLQNTSEEFLLHPIVEDVEKTYAAAVATGVHTKNNDSDTFTEYYRFHEKPCSYWNCPIHFGNLRVFKHPKFLLAGESESHPWVLKRNRLEDLIRFAQLVQATTSSIMTLDSMSKLSELDDDGDDDLDDDNIPSSYYHDHDDEQPQSQEV
jgi:hypothetical protein